MMFLFPMAMKSREVPDFYSPQLLFGAHGKAVYRSTHDAFASFRAIRRGSFSPVAWQESHSIAPCKVGGWSARLCGAVVGRQFVGKGAGSYWSLHKHLNDCLAPTLILPQRGRR